jgi:hypothetical protein
VAYHAAEAIAFLDLREARSATEAISKEPDPRLPTKAEVESDAEPVLVVNELVRINHLSNCLLCHGPSTSAEDPVRGRIPIPGENPPPLYYAESTGLFARADITFLRQDFSVVQPVLKPLTWPGQQRFDYLLRKRKPTEKELELATPLPQRTGLERPFATKPEKIDLPLPIYHQEAARFALRSLAKSSGPSLERPLAEDGATPGPLEKGLKVPPKKK